MAGKGNKNKSNKDELSASPGRNEKSNFTEADRQKLYKIYDTVASLTKQVSKLQKRLKKSDRKIEELKTENEKLKQVLNLNTLEIDNLQQYSRRENIRIHGIPEPKDKKDDGEKVVVELAEKLGITLDSYDIQRAHRLGRMRSPRAKPRPIIARFVKYKHRNDILFSKSKLKECNDEKFKNAFITEDLTPLRSKLLNYVKNDCEGKFVLCHTYNGRIRMKKSALKQGVLTDGSKDEGSGNWIVISSPEDLFRLDINVDFAKLDYKPMLFNEVSHCDSEGSSSESLE